MQLGNKLPVEELDSFACVVEHVFGGKALGLRDVPDLNEVKQDKNHANKNFEHYSVEVALQKVPKSQGKNNGHNLQSAIFLLSKIST